MATIFIVMIFMLSGLGVAYAAWFDTIHINGTAQTGSLCWHFTTVELRDELAPVNFGGDFPVPEDDADYTCFPGFAYNPAYEDYFWHLDKNVGWGALDKMDTDGDGYSDTVYLWLNNTYPCYFNELTMYLRNCGTIPLKINNVVIEDTNGNTYYLDSGEPYIALDLNNNGVDDFELWWNEAYWGYQVHPGSRSPELSLWMHVLQDEDPAFQDGSFGFYVYITAVQWNEYPYDLS